ncbi:MAG: hypothetical protein R3E36_13215 [Nitrosomonas sp.]|nr:hypothetical protein [Nitrosomonas sp.]
MARAHDLAASSTVPQPAEYRIAAATYSADLARWHEEAASFCIVGGVTFGLELDAMLRELLNFSRTLAGLASEPHIQDSKKRAYLREQLAAVEDRTLVAIDSVPIDWNARLFEERTPFSTCMSIRDALLTAHVHVHYFDRYLSTDFFPLYLRDLSRSLSIKLITTPGNNSYGVKSVLPIATLAAQEFADFQLLECDPADMHDRNLRVDERVFFLGPSANSAGRYPTNFAPADSTAIGHAILDNLVAKARRAI